jgi:hypothetical protein
MVATMVAKRKKWAMVVILALLSILVFLGWAVIAPSYERGRRYYEDLGGEPGIHKDLGRPNN